MKTILTSVFFSTKMCKSRMIVVFRRTYSPVSRMFAQMWAAHNLSQWYSALINSATRAAYFRDAVGITPVTGIYRGFCRREDTRAGGGGRGNRRVGRERDGPTSPVFTVLGGCGIVVGETARGWTREEDDGARVCTETQRKEKGGGILGTRIDAVLSNHVLRLLPLCLSSDDSSLASRVPSPLLLFFQWNPRPARVESASECSWYFFFPPVE